VGVELFERDHKWVFECAQVRSRFNKSVTLSIVLLMVSVAGCTTRVDSSPTTVDLVRPSNDVLSAVSDLDEELGSVAPDHELAMAWADLRDDIRSFVPDLTRNPHRVDIDGFKKRVTSFPGRHDTIDHPSIHPQWIELVDAFDTLVVMVSERGQSANSPALSSKDAGQAG
jgi:hypothetical protein